MIVLGLVLLLVVVALTVLVVTGGRDPVHLHLHWFTVGANGTALFIAGATSVVVTALALWMLRAGIRRSRHRRREIKELRQRTTKAQVPPPTSHQDDADDYYDTAPRD